MCVGCLVHGAHNRLTLLSHLLALVVLRARADCRNSGATGPLLTSSDNGRQLLDVLCGAS